MGPIKALGDQVLTSFDVPTFTFSMATSGEFVVSWLHYNPTYNLPAASFDPLADLYEAWVPQHSHEETPQSYTVSSRAS